MIDKTLIINWELLKDEVERARHKLIEWKYTNKEYSKEINICIQRYQFRIWLITK